LQGERDPARLADLAEKRLRQKIPQLPLAPEGNFTQHHQYLIESLPDHLESLERQIGAFGLRIAECLQPFQSAAEVDRLDELVGVNRCTIENVVAEIGVDMNQFPSGMCCDACPPSCVRSLEFSEQQGAAAHPSAAGPQRRGKSNTAALPKSREALS
jgi:hypothetical protein